MRILDAGGATVPLMRTKNDDSRPFFSDRERQVIDLVSLGLCNKEIGSELGITTHTVTSTLQRMYLKAGVHRRAALVRMAFEHAARPARLEAESRSSAKTKSSARSSRALRDR